MPNYKIRFNNGKYFTTRKCKNKAELVNTAFFFDKNGIDYTAEEYKKDKETQRFGWNSFTPSVHCRRCGRELTNPESVKNGIGPECIKKVGRTKNFPASDNLTQILPSHIADKVLESISQWRKDECQFCRGQLNPTVYYYEHDGGWYVEALGKKVWLWVECEKCGHQWSLTHLGVYRSQSF